MFSTANHCTRPGCLIGRLLACVALVFADLASAADPVRGAALFASPARPGLLPCSDCHSDDPIVNNFGNIWSGRNAPALIERAVQSNTGGMGVFQGLYGPAEFADIAAYLGNAPGSLEFAPTLVGGLSAPQRITISSSLKTGIEALRLATDGDFVLVDTSCGSEIPRFAACTVEVAFRPSLPGIKAGALVISHAGTRSPVRLPLRGEGVLPPAVAEIAPTRIDFGERGLKRHVEVRNQSDAPLRLFSIKTVPNDFLLAGGTCVAGHTLAPGQRCDIAIGAPKRDGKVRQGTLHIVHDGVGAGSTIELTATGSVNAKTSLRADVVALDFSAGVESTASPAQLVNVVNVSDSSVALREVVVDHVAFSTEGSSCRSGRLLAPGELCQVAVAYVPRRVGAVSEELRIATTDGAAPLRVGLSARSGAAAPSAALGQLRLRAQLGGETRATVSFVNASSAPWRVRGLSLAGPNASDFKLVDSDCATGATLLPNTHCAARVAFVPQNEGSRLARLRLDADAGGASVDLLGSASKAPSPEVWLDSVLVDFGPHRLGQPSAAQTLVVHNRGDEGLVWEHIGMTGDDAGAFAWGGSCQEGSGLPAGASCRVEVRFVPYRQGEHLATLVFWQQGGPRAAVTVRGQGLDATAGLLASDRLSVDFGKVPLSSAGSSQRIRLRNTGGATAPAPLLSTDNPVFSWALANPACSAGVPPAGSCDIEIRFRPTAPGKQTATLRVGSPGPAGLAIALAGEAAASSPLLTWHAPPNFFSSPPAFVGTVESGATWILVNRGNLPSSPLRWLIDGPAAGEFSFAAGTTCARGRVIEPNGSCVVQIAFHPRAAGERVARLLLLSDSLEPVALSARGIAPAAADLQARPTVVVFEARTNAPTPAQRLLLRNEGAAAARIGALEVAGAAFSFMAGSADSCGGELLVLLPGEDCELTASWDGSAAGARGGRLSAVVAGDGSGTTVELVVHEDPAQRMNVGGGGGAMHWALLWMLALGLAAHRLGRSE